MNSIIDNGRFGEEHLAKKAIFIFSVMNYRSHMRVATIQNKKKIGCADFNTVMHFIGPISIIALQIVLTIIFTLYVLPVGCNEKQPVLKTFTIIGFSLSIFCEIMCTFSLFVAAYTDPGATKNVVANHEFLEEHPLLTDDYINSCPTCQKCGLPKPPRAHHCSTCGRCHLKMDHHCNALGTCIALRNQKAFILLLEYGVHALDSAIITGIIILIWAKKFSFEILLIVVSMTMMWAVLVFFYTDNRNRARHNITVIEQMSSTDVVCYDLGRIENDRQIFGSSRCTKSIPLPNKEMTGFEWSQPEYIYDGN